MKKCKAAKKVAAKCKSVRKAQGGNTKMAKKIPGSKSKGY